MKKSTIRLILPFLIFFTFILISLGGATRAMHAGLSCPDWPLCFGDVIPDYQIQVYYEFIHRAVAGFVGLIILILAFGIFKSKEVSRETKVTMGLAIVVLFAQIILGALTVLKLLHAGVVTSHLAFGMALFALLIWMYLTVGEYKLTVKEKMPKTFYGFAGFALLVIYGQIILGGLVSTNYAGMACADFPLCQGEFVPTMQGLIGLQISHRLGAYFVAITLVSMYLLASKNRHQSWMDKQYMNICGLLVIGVLVQIGLGAANVWFKIPPLITVLHLAVAATLLGLVLKLLYLARLQAKTS